MIEAQAASSSPSTWNFVRHLLEMLAAMVAGMFLLGGLVSLVFLTLGQSEIYDRAALRALIMAVDMTVGMGLWMRHRGHSLMQIGEMSAAMFLPLAILIYPYWSGLIARGALLGGMHVLMIPAMVGVMLYRRDVYGREHRHHSAAEATPRGSTAAHS